MGPSISGPEPESSLADQFERVADRCPDRVAVWSPRAALTYANLDRLANQVARAVLDSGGDPGSPVGLLLGHDDRMVTGILGVLKAGRPYVPLDPRLPPDRLADVVRGCEVSLIIQDAVEADASRFDLASVIEFGSVGRLASSRPGLVIPPGEVACVLSTSGSTGGPRGVCHTHRTLLHNARCYARAAGICPDDRLSAVSPFQFAAAASNLFGALLTGASLHPYDMRGGGLDGLVAMLAEHRVTIWHSVPTLFRRLIEALLPDRHLPALRLVRLGGEPVYRSDLALLRGRFAPACRLHISYSSTETLNICHDSFHPDDEVLTDRLPVGRPAEGMEVMIADPTGAPVACGEVGEIVVRSRYLATGYRGPAGRKGGFEAGPDSEVCRFGTGDLGRLLPDGRLEHLGRADDRVKIRGHRVDPGVVEAALRDLGAGDHVAVIAHDDESREPRLVAYLATPGRPGRWVSDLRRALQSRLPEHMVPSAFVVLDALPTTTTGKVDRRRLPPPGPGHPDAHTPPRTDQERAVASVWVQLLKSDTIGVHDDFFELGGDSLLAARMIHRVGRDVGLKLELADVYRTPTIAALCAAPADRLTGPRERRVHLEVLREGKGSGPVVCVGFLDCLRSLLTMLPDEVPVWWLRFDGVFPPPPTIRPVPEIAAALAAELTAAAPTGHMILFGYSFTGLLAYELAQQLRLAGRDLDVILVEPSPPGGSALLQEEGWAHTHRRLKATVKRGPWETLRWLSAGLQWMVWKRVRRAWHKLLWGYYALGMTLGWWEPGPDRRWWYFEPVIRRRIREYSPTFCPGVVHVVAHSGWRESRGRAWPEHSAGGWVWHEYPEATDHLGLAALPAATWWLALIRDLTAARAKE
jgi:amino acid adenylation domain-containing protein